MNEETSMELNENDRDSDKTNSLSNLDYLKKCYEE
jgi:hypothetical protein